MSRSKPEPLLTFEEVNDIIAMLMRIDANVAWIRAAMEEDDGEDASGS